MKQININIDVYNDNEPKTVADISKVASFYGWAAESGMTQELFLEESLKVQCEKLAIRLYSDAMIDHEAIALAAYQAEEDARSAASLYFED